MDGRAALLSDLMEDAYRRPRGPDGDGHSLLANVETVRENDWDRLPPGCMRTIRDIVLHVGSCKYMYDDYAFRSASLTWDAPPAWPVNCAVMPVTDVLAWLDGSHRLLSESMRGLSDTELEGERRTNWGERWPARRIISAMIEHDLYHAGEINHIRGLLAGDDRWAYAAG